MFGAKQPLPHAPIPPRTEGALSRFGERRKAMNNNVSGHVPTRIE